MSRRRVWVIDTTVLVEILDIPGMSKAHKASLAEFGDRVNSGDRFELPFAVIVETGNHVGQNGSPSQRRKVAERFCAFIDGAVSGAHPWRVMGAPDLSVLREWISLFPAHVERDDAKSKGSGLGDLTIVETVGRLRKTLDKTDVDVWTLDQHLARLCQE